MKKTTLNRVKTVDFLEKLTAEHGQTCRALYLPPNLSLGETESLIKEIQANPEITAKLREITVPSPSGAAIIRKGEQKYLIIPPCPIKEKNVVQSLDTAPLLSLIRHDYIIGIVLVRLGSYAIGVSHGDKLISSKVGTGLVHGRHRQCGSSAHRFERHRDKQIESFLIRVCGHIREQFEPYEKSLDYIVYGGARTTILMAQKYCPWLEKLAKPTLPPLLDIPEPRQPILEAAVSRIWSSTIYEFSDD
ncbi:MAG: Vms1/Ankzf1 family peptidyl-tRNA hydrolase [Dehalococcoidales bacterium]